MLDLAIATLRDIASTHPWHADLVNQIVESIGVIAKQRALASAGEKRARPEPTAPAPGPVQMAEPPAAAVQQRAADLEAIVAGQ